MKRFYFIMLAAILFSCATEEKGQLEQINVSIKNSSDYNLSEIADEVTPIILETKKECLISYVSKLVSTKDFLYVLNANTSLYQFDKQGKFIRQIGDIGRGPGEYERLSTFTIDEDNNVVYAASNYKILSYKDNGEFIGESDFTRGYIISLSYINDQLLLFSRNIGIKTNEGYKNEIKLFKLDNNLSYKDSFIVSTIIHKTMSASSIIEGNYISNLEDHIYVNFPSPELEPVVRDTLFELKDNLLLPSLRLNIEEEVQGNTGNSRITINDFYRKESYIFTSYSYQKKRNLLTINLTNGKQMNMEDGFNDDFYDTGTVKLSSLSLNDNQLYFLKNGYELEGKIENVDENSNPVVFIVKLK
ncbi:MAG: 6-bladed beta-propeller [Prolixibacteraceae bacterium]|nr:6-bladed beta-propeller [Prolixibacteraceae bacterium]